MEEIKNKLKSVIKEIFGIDFDAEVTAAPAGVEADYSSNVAMKLAKVLHKSPMEIAQLIETEINASQSRLFEPAVAGLTHFEPVVTGSGHDFKAFISVSVSAPGFLNFILPDEYYVKKIEDFSADFDKNISSDEYSGKTVICEFSDPNPFKVLHVGHLYTSMVGDAISRLFEYAGAKVIRANFGGDVGLHVAKTMYSLMQKNMQDLTIEDIAKCYVEGTRAYDEDEIVKAEITKLNKKIYEINKNDEHGTDLADLYWKGRELSYDYFKDFYARIGVKFDKFYPESTVADLGLSKVKEQLAAGVYQLSDNAVVFRGEDYGLHTRVFINKEGVPTYETKDVGLIFRKWEDWKFDKSVVITGNEQLDYMKVVLKSVEQYAPELVEKTSHLTHGLVKLAGNVKMSSRKGNFLKAVDVLDMISEELKESYNSEDEKIVLGATKYAFLKYKMGGDIIFDPKESVKMTGNSGPYLLYSCVRAKKIIERIQKTSSSGRSSGPSLRASLLSPRSDCGFPSENVFLNSSERTLAKKILEYKWILGEAVAEMAPHKVAGYLYELAQEFSRFYENCPVVGNEFEIVRGKLVKVYYETMLHGLHILGIEVPEEM